MSEETKLLPCPFCGNDVNDDEGCFQAGGFKAGSTPYFVVRCGNPNCNADVSGVTRDGAIAAWNSRAPKPAEVTDAMVKRAFKALYVAIEGEKK